MKRIYYSLLILLFGLTGQQGYSQLQTAKWYFGGQAGLDFMGMPTILTNGMMNPWEGCASISDASGALLFYTDGITVWNKTHAVMTNGTGLFGNGSSTQAGVIVQRPGSANIYYIFTVDAQAAPNGLRYSTVDMSMSAGNGAVTVKNTLLQTPSDEKITAVRHCNGVDIWVVTHDWNSNNFRSFLVTAAGVGAPVNSAVGNVHSGSNANTIGQMKASPNGRKIGLAVHDSPLNSFELFDFDNSTGVVSNPLVLGTTYNWAYGCEFSPDGTKFYGGKYGGGSYRLYQWNMCAGSSAAIIASCFTVATMPAMPMSIQAALNGKLYVCRFSQQIDGVINAPNALGAACNYVDLGQSTAPRTNNLGLPNFVTSYLKSPPPPFTYTVNSAVSCLTASFSPPAISTVAATCSSAGFSVTGMTWTFGDPGSGPLNTSTLTNPGHLYPGPGTYTAQLIINYACNADTIKVPVTLVSPTIAITTTSASCSSLGSATVVAGGGAGPYTYTWSPSAQNTAIATNLSAGIYTVTVQDVGGGCVVTGTANLGASNLMSGTVTSSSVACNGGTTGSATLSISGGSGNYSYSWTPSAQTTSVATNLAAGVYTVISNDLSSSCSVTQTVMVAQPSALTLGITASTPSACVGTNITLTANASGGTAAYNYAWSAGPATAAYVVTQAVGGNYTYSATTTDANLCQRTNTFTVTFVNNPTLTATSSTVCVGTTATLTANGATSYTWNPGNVIGSTFTSASATTTTMTVIGAIGTCSATTTAIITVNALPTPTAGSNSPVCVGDPINLTGSAAVTYTWAGPSGFTSNVQNPVIPICGLANGGTNTLTVTDANGCTNFVTVNVVVNPLPTIVVNNPTVCVNQAINFTATGGATYLWSGPNSFTSNLQNPTIPSATLNMSGPYTVLVTSAAGCSNTAVSTATVYALPNPNITSNSPVCAGQTLNLFGSGGASYAWSGPGYTGLLQNPTISNVTAAANGVYTLLVASGSCTASTTFTVVINPIPVFNFAGTNVLCNGQSNGTSTVNVTVGTGPFNYNWSTIPAQTTQDATGLAAGTYSCIVTDANNCSSVASTQITQPTQFSVSINSATFSACANSPINVNAIGNGGTGPYNYNWVSGPATGVYSVNEIVAGNYTYTVNATDAFNCPASNFINLTFFPQPTVTATSATVCAGQTTNLTASGATSYVWQPGNITGSTYPFSGNTSINVSVIGTANGCSNSANTNVMVNPNPNASINLGNAKGCVPTCVTFSAGGSSSITSYGWILNGAGITGSVNGAYCFDEAASYTLGLTVMDAFGCTSTVVPVNIEIYPQPIADFNHAPIKPIVNQDPFVTFTDASYGAPIVSWNWYFMNTAQYTSILQNPTFPYTEPGTYPVVLVVKSDRGCTDTLVRPLVVGEDFGIYVPNVFTPNGDGLNDIFQPKGFGVVKYEMNIFDRWGEKVFSTKDFEKGWDGTMQSKNDVKYGVLEDGAYTWLINATSVFGKSHELKGHVTLMK
ncbi:MAG: gliding motility-associated C-terminal domain-containing protein [Bacteroidia bacterium]|nr:gliding motility-associated C-terminal domain-containing protein [Bacteroidia bacterium]